MTPPLEEDTKAMTRRIREAVGQVFDAVNGKGEA